MADPIFLGFLFFGIVALIILIAVGVEVIRKASRYDLGGYVGHPPQGPGEKSNRAKKGVAELGDPVLSSEGFEIGPGGVLVVGPNGRFAIRRNRQDGSFRIWMERCDILGPHDMSDAQKELVNEVWEGWSDDGQQRIN